MQLSQVNNGGENCIFKVAEIEKKYSAKYVGEFCLKTKDGGWANEAASIFYQKIPPVAGYSHYFALIKQNGQIFITSGASAVEGTILGIKAKNGEIIYSQFRNDYRTSKDNSVFIDGGRDYTKSSLNELIPMNIVDGKFVQIAPVIAKSLKI